MSQTTRVTIAASMHRARDCRACAIVSLMVVMLSTSESWSQQLQRYYEPLMDSSSRDFLNVHSLSHEVLPDVINKAEHDENQKGEAVSNSNNTGVETRVSQNPGSQNRRRSSSRPRFDSQQVERGRVAFEESCTQCHDAERSLEKKKSRTGWLATVRRMARLDDADIANSDIVPIATYLASLSQPQSVTGPRNGDLAANNMGDSNGKDDSSGNGSEFDGADAAGDLADEALAELETFGSGLNISGTISPQWRGGNDNLENPGFFVDAWGRADWQPSGPLRARVTACTSCHSDQTNNGGFTLELVEATATIDLLHWRKEKDKRPEHCKPNITAELRAGRFVVPFGAFAGMSHPGIYRTVSNPLMYNMGRQVNADRSNPPVLPAPYSDEGVDLFVKLGITEKVDATMNLYGVNGLQGSNAGLRFTPSRGYSDNNEEPALGGRATIGNAKVRFGGSVMSGRMQDQMAAPLNYKYSGADVTARFFENLIRIYFEYAIRTNESIFPDDQIGYGTVTEIEAQLFDKPNINALARFDTLEHRNQTGQSSVERFTWGVSTTSIGGSLLMMNHELWHFSDADEKDVDVLGIRWVATF